MAVNQLPYEPIRFTGMGSDRRQHPVVEHHTVLVVPLQEAFVQHVPFAEQDVVSFASVVPLDADQRRASLPLSLIHI